MAQYRLKAPNGKTYVLNAPPGASDEELIARVVAFDPEAGVTPPAPAKKKGFLANLEQGARSSASAAKAGLGALFGDEQAAAKTALAEQQQISSEYENEVGLDRLKQAYDARGLLGAAGEAVRQAPLFLAQSAPEMGATIGGAYAGAKLGARAGLPGLVAGGVGGALAGFLPNVGRNVAEQEEATPGQISVGRAAAAAAGQSALDAASLGAVAGRRVLTSVLGPGAEDVLKRLGPQAADAMVRQSLLRRAGAGALGGAAVEGGTETLQTMLGRAQAGKALFDEEALKEYAESAYGGALLGGPLGGAGKAYDAAGQNAQLEQTQRREALDARMRAAQEQEAGAASAEEERLARMQDPAYLGELQQRYAAFEQQKAALIEQQKAAKAEKSDAGDALAKDLRRQIAELSREAQPLVQEYNAARPLLKRMQAEQATTQIPGAKPQEQGALFDQEDVGRAPVQPQAEEDPAAALAEIDAQLQRGRTALVGFMRQGNLQQAEALQRGIAQLETQRSELTQRMPATPPAIDVRKVQAELARIQTQLSEITDPAEFNKAKKLMQRRDALQAQLQAAPPPPQETLFQAADREYAQEMGAETDMLRQQAQRPPAAQPDLFGEQMAELDAQRDESNAERQAAAGEQRIDEAFNRTFASQTRDPIQQTLMSGQLALRGEQALPEGERRGIGAEIAGRLRQLERVDREQWGETAKTLQQEGAAAKAAIIKAAQNNRPEAREAVRRLAELEQQTKGRAHHTAEFYDIVQNVLGRDAVEPFLETMGVPRGGTAALNEQTQREQAPLLYNLRQRIGKVDDPRLTAAMEAAGDEETPQLPPGLVDEDGQTRLFAAPGRGPEAAPLQDQVLFRIRRALNNERLTPDTRALLERMQDKADPADPRPMAERQRDPRPGPKPPEGLLRQMAETLDQIEQGRGQQLGGARPAFPGEAQRVAGTAAATQTLPNPKGDTPAQRRANLLRAKPETGKELGAAPTVAASRFADVQRMERAPEGKRPTLTLGRSTEAPDTDVDATMRAGESDETAVAQMDLFSEAALPATVSKPPNPTVTSFKRMVAAKAAALKNRRSLAPRLETALSLKGMLQWALRREQEVLRFRTQAEERLKRIQAQAARMSPQDADAARARIDEERMRMTKAFADAQAALPALETAEQEALADAEQRADAEAEGMVFRGKKDKPLKRALLAEQKASAKRHEIRMLQEAIDSQNALSASLREGGTAVLERAELDVKSTRDSSQAEVKRLQAEIKKVDADIQSIQAQMRKLPAENAPRSNAPAMQNEIKQIDARIKATADALAANPDDATLKRSLSALQDDRRELATRLREAGVTERIAALPTRVQEEPGVADKREAERVRGQSGEDYARRTAMPVTEVRALTPQERAERSATQILNDALATLPEAAQLDEATRQQVVAKAAAVPTLRAARERLTQIENELDRARRAVEREAKAREGQGTFADDADAKSVVEKQRRVDSLEQQYKSERSAERRAQLIEEIDAAQKALTLAKDRAKQRTLVAAGQARKAGDTTIKKGFGNAQRAADAAELERALIEERLRAAGLSDADIIREGYAPEAAQAAWRRQMTAGDLSAADAESLRRKRNVEPGTRVDAEGSLLENMQAKRADKPVRRFSAAEAPFTPPRAPNPEAAEKAPAAPAAPDAGEIRPNLPKAMQVVVRRNVDRLRALLRTVKDGPAQTAAERRLQLQSAKSAEQYVNELYELENAYSGVSKAVARAETLRTQIEKKVAALSDLRQQRATDLATIRAERASALQRSFSERRRAYQAQAEVDLDRAAMDRMADEGGRVARAAAGQYAQRQDTLMNADAREAALDGRIMDVLDTLAKNGSTPLVRELAAKLKPLLMRTSLEVKDSVVVDGQDVAAAYSSERNGIDMNVGALTEEDFLHEAVHAATLRALRADPKTLTPEQRNARAELERLYAAAQKNPAFANEYGKVNLEEFAAEVMSNPQARTAIDSMPPGWWKRFKDVLLRLIGFKPPTDSERAMRAVERLFQPSRPIKGATVASARRGALQEFADSITAPEPAKGPLKFLRDDNFGLAAEMALVDQRAPILKALSKGDEAKYLQAQYYLRKNDARMSQTMAVLDNGPAMLKKDAKGRFVVETGNGPSAKDIFTAIGDIPVGREQDKINIAQAYLVAQRAANKGWDKLGFAASAELRRAGEAALAEAKADPQLKAALDRVRELYNAYNKGMIQFLVESEAMTPDAGKALLKDGDYVPFYRVGGNGVAELVLGEAKPIIVGDVRNQPYLAALKGDDTKLMPLNEALMRNTMLLTDMGLRNLTTKSVAYALQSMGSDSPKGTNKIMVGTPPAGADVIKFFHRPDPNNSKDTGERWMRVSSEGTAFEGIPSEMLVKSLEGVHTVVDGVVGNFFKFFGDLLRKGVTRSPVYVLRQLIRDPMTAAFTAGIDRGPLLATMKAFREFGRQQIGASELAKELQRKGVVQSGVFTGDPDDLKQFALQLTRGNQGRIVQLISMVDRMAMQADAATRAQVYEDTLKRTGSEMQAELAAMEMMNFSKRGSMPFVQRASRIIPFLNAQIQGLNVLAKAMRGNASQEEQLQIQQKFIKNAVGLSALTLLYATMMDENEAYKNATAQERFSNFFVPLPSGDAIRIPIPYEVGFLFKALPEVAVRGAKGDATFEGDGKALLKMAFNTIPGGSNYFLPQAAKPALEVLMNRSIFTDREIETAAQQRVEKQYRYGDTTTELAKGLSPLLGGLLSPVQIDHLVRGYLGTIPIGIMQLSNEVLAPPSSVERPERRLAQMPIVGALFQDRIGRGAADLAYAKMQAIDVAAGTYDKLVKEGKHAAALKYMEDNVNLLAAEGPTKRFRELFETLRERRQLILSSPMDAARKRVLIEQVDAKMQELSHFFVDAVTRVVPAQ